MGCLAPRTLLRYDRPVPCTDDFEGVYLDDHSVLAVCPRRSVHSADGPDEELTRKSHLAYERERVERAVDKGFGFSCAKVVPGTARGATRFLAWGTQVDGLRGMARCPEQKCIEIWALTLICVCLRNGS